MKTADPIPTRAQRPLVLALHCSTANGRQWDALATELAGSHDVLAPDLYGHGHCPAWTAAAPLTLDDEVDRLVALLPPRRPL
ncbi:MAG: alpha/beta fold hydrolase, partial [Aquabacterium sp.]